jgi:hypothetical protein
MPIPFDCAGQAINTKVGRGAIELPEEPKSKPVMLKSSVLHKLPVFEDRTMDLRVLRETAKSLALRNRRTQEVTENRR